MGKRTTLLATAARLLVDGPPDGVQRRDVLEAALEAVRIRHELLPPEPAPSAHRTEAGERPVASEPVAESPHPYLLASEEEQTLRELAAWSIERSARPFGLLESARTLERGSDPEETGCVPLCCPWRRRCARG